MNFLIPIFTRRAKVEAVSILPISGGRGLSGRVHPYPLEGMGAFQTGTPLSPQGTGTFRTGTPLSPQGTGTFRTGTPLSPQGTEAFRTGTPLSPQGTGTFRTGTPLSPQGTWTFWTGTPLSPGGDGDWRGRYSSGSSTSWVRSSFTLSFPTLSTNSLRRGCRVAWR